MYRRIASCSLYFIYASMLSRCIDIFPVAVVSFLYNPHADKPTVLIQNIQKHSRNVSYGCTLFRQAQLSQYSLWPLLRPSTLTSDYLPWQVTHGLYVHIQWLTIASWSRLFGSVVRALDFYPNRPGSNPTTGGKFFQLCFIPLLRLHVVRWGPHPGSNFISPKMASRHHKWWLPWKGECYGLALLPSIICLC